MSEESSSQITSEEKPKFGGWVRRLLSGKSDTTLREAIEELIEEDQDNKNGESESIAQHEYMLITNVLGLRDLSVVDVMVPRADIVAVEASTPPDELHTLLSAKPHSRLPIYRENLDDVIGMIHLKDIFTKMREQENINLAEVTRPVTFVSPAMKVLDLLLQMRQSQVHMAMVIDEFGGIDGLITINDLIEAIVGEIEDEHDLETTPVMVERKDGAVLADARTPIEDFENKYGKFFTEGNNAQEMNDVDTLGGIVFALAGRIPSRGEIIKDKSGIEFEIIEADPRKIMKLRIRNIPRKDTEDRD